MKFTQFVAASGHWAAYYDATQDTLVLDQVTCWGLGADGVIYGLVLERDTGCLVLARDYANYIAVVSNSDLKAMTAELLERGRAMRSWLLEEAR